MSGAKERWLPAVGFPDYDVSDLGRVRSRKRRYTRIMRVSPQRKGYLRVTLSSGGKPLTILVHRLVLEAFVGPRPAGMECLHRDGSRTNNRLSNIRWGTHLENVEDMRRHAKPRKLFPPELRARGERVGNARLNPRLVREIRKCTDLLAIAARTGISIGAIRAAKAGITWRHVA